MDVKYLNERLKELGIYSEYYHRLELKPLSNYLYFDDKVNCIFTGVWEANRRLVAITQSKIIIIMAGPLVQTQVTVINRTAVSSWKFNAKFLLSSVEIEAQGKKYVFTLVQRGRKALFEHAMNEPIKEFDR